jgi:excisionase family DNA binding protein
MSKRGEEDSTVRPGPASGSDGGRTPVRPDPLLRPPEVARLLACSTKTVYAWAASGFLPSIRLGRLVRFRAGDVRRFVEGHADNRPTRETW